MLIIESIHDNIIKIEDGDVFFTILSDMIKGTFKEGDILILREDGFYEVDLSATNARRKKIFDLQNDIFE